MYDPLVHSRRLPLPSDLLAFVLLGIISAPLRCRERAFLDVEGGRGLAGGAM